MTKQEAAQTLQSYLKFLRSLGYSYLSKEPKVALSKEVALERLKEVAVRCRKCSLAQARTKVVFGEGSPEAKLVFVGEAPGEQEDKQGRPFVGAAGNLLTQLIKDIGLSRQQVFICNVIKCRPPRNRDPLPEEIASCEPYLVKQLEIIRPLIICTLGKHATHTLLRTKEPISRLRGRIFMYHNFQLLPTLHPANILYHPANKRLIDEDMEKLKATFAKLSKKSA